MRIILTGSRTWTDHDMIRDVLARVFMAHPDAVLVQGDAVGVDTIGKNIWRSAGGQVDTFPIASHQWRAPCGPDCEPGHRKRRFDPALSRWYDYCPAVGHRRNQQMADAGADLCIAFRMPGVSNGTDDMIRRARAVGIPVRVYTPDGQPSLF